MKKILFYLLFAIAGIMVTGCSSCKSENKKQEKSKEVAKLIVENTISTDREYMFLNHGKGVRFYESCVLLKDWLDSEGCDGTVAGVGNVFQYTEDGEPYVVSIVHTPNGKDSIDIKHGFWTEDETMNHAAIRVTYEEAFEKAMQANYPKPHSHNCILRKPLGPKECNPQWVFGNIEEQIWVDAVTGEVRNSNPSI